MAGLILFGAFFVLLLFLVCLLFSNGFRGRKAVEARLRMAAETAKSLTHP